MSRSYIAEQIDREYKREQYYKKRERQKCKEKECVKCEFLRFARRVRSSGVAKRLLSNVYVAK